VIEGVTPVAVTAMLNILLDPFSPVKLYKINSFHIGMQPVVTDRLGQSRWGNAFYGKNKIRDTGDSSALFCSVCRGKLSQLRIILHNKNPFITESESLWYH
jgi:hypothetical protein